MIETFKILSDIYDKRVTGEIFELTPRDSTTRGHQYKLVKRRCRLDQIKNYFTNRVVDTWNNLPESVLLAKTVKIFENRLDKVWENHPMLYDYNEDRHQPGSSLCSRSIQTDVDPNTEECAELLRSTTT